MTKGRWRIQWDVDEKAAKAKLDEISTSVRSTSTEDGRNLFVALDVCRAIGMLSPNAAIKLVCRESPEYGLFKDSAGRPAWLRVISKNDALSLVSLKYRKRSRMKRLVCKRCGKQFGAHKDKAESSKYCSTNCQREETRKEKNTQCTECGKEYHLKPSAKKQRRKYGYFCSHACFAKHRREHLVFDNNPNWKGRNVDENGYRLYVPAAQHSLGETPLRRMKLHQAVCCEALCVSRIKKGLHIHHRDCDITNNAPENLAIMTPSDHKWLHQQFGVVTLRAFMAGEVDMYDLVSWSDDALRAERLLIQDITIQSAFSQALGATDPCAAAVSIKPIRAQFIVVDSVAKDGGRNED